MSKELAVRESAELERPAQTLLESVMRAVANPEIDPARLREFLEIGKELEALEAKKQYNIAWARLMPKLPFINKNGLIVRPPSERSKGSTTSFAKWDDIHLVCMPMLYEEGFAVSFDSKHTPGSGELTVVVIITHNAGHEERREFTVPWLDTGGSKSPAQAASSSFTLAQRHAFCKAFNILTKDVDDDGSGQGVPDKITEEQIRKIQDILHACEDKEANFTPRFRKWLKAEFSVDSETQLFQGSQLDAATKKLSEKMEALKIS